MAIKERKQITGTEAQIKGYAGHNGVLAYATDTKHLHVLSGTAGTTTKLANMSDIPAPVDISGKADKTYVDTELAKKQAKGDYATNTALTQGLAGKANSSHTHTSANVTDLNVTISNALKPYATTNTVNTELAKKANESHTHTVSQITDMPKVVLSVNGQAPNDDGNVTIEVKSALPNYSSYVEVSTGNFTPTYDGWIRLNLSPNRDNNSFSVQHTKSGQYILLYSQERYQGSGWFMCPLVAGETYKISSSGGEIYFHPMR